MTLNERIGLHNELYNTLRDRNILTYSKRWDRYMFPPRKDKFQKELDRDQDLCNKYTTYIKEFRSEKEAIYCLTHIDDYTNHLCPVCKTNLCDFYEAKSLYKKTCNDSKCIQSMIHTEEARTKYEQTNMDRYGASYILQTKKGKEKFKQTNLERYGVEYSAQNKEIYAKTQQTNLERYGDTCSARNEEVKAKQAKTNLERYGTKCSLNSESYKNTLLDKFGVSNYNQRNITNFDIYSDDEKFENFIKSKYSEKSSPLLLREIYPFFNIHPDTLSKKVKSMGLDKYFYIQDSNMEIQFKDFLLSHNITDFERCNRDTIPSNDMPNKFLEIDFLIEHKLGIEINDIVTHCIKEKDKYYHLYKTTKSLEHNIRLIHIWEWEFRDDKLCDRLLKWILNLLNSNKMRVFARKCELKQVPIEDEKIFLRQYHLQGYIKSELCYGLYYNNELIQLMSFCKPRYNKKYQWELLRLCTKFGYVVIGGANRLLKNFIRSNSPTSIISYCDLSKFTGKVYEEIGFNHDHNTEPKLLWCNKDMKHFSQSSLTMVGADKLIGTNYGKGTSNEKIAIKHGYLPIYNCGLGVYTLELDSK